MKASKKRIMMAALAVAGWSLLLAARRARALDLRGRVAIVTGGGRGLGLAISRELLQRGCRLAIAGRDGEVIRRAAEELSQQGFEVLGQPCDASDPDQARTLVEATVARYGRVDVLVNNAGQCFVGPVAELEPGDMQLALRHIFWAQYHPTMAVLPHMRRRRFGRIANVTSIGGKLPLAHQAAYVAGKFAATGWSEALSIELDKDGIRVATVAPPPLANGAPLHAHFNGRRDEELAWFARALTSRWSATGAERAARADVDAIVLGRRESAVSLASWIGARAHGLAPSLTASVLAWVDRRLPPPAEPGGSSPMRLGWAVARASADPEVRQLAARARQDEERYLPAGAPSALPERLHLGAGEVQAEAQQ